MSVAIIIDEVYNVINFVNKFIPDPFVKKILFDGEPNPKHKTTDFFNKLIAKYENSIESINKTFILNAVIIFFVTYPLLANNPSGNFKIPLIDFEITNNLWIKIAPTITLFTQLYFLANLIWFQILKRGIEILLHDDTENQFSDIRNISLSGIVSILYLIFMLRKKHTSRLSLTWYIPFFILTLLISVTPLILSIILIINLFKQKIFMLGFLYSFLTLPVIFLGLVLIAHSISFLVFRNASKKKKNERPTKVFM